MYFPKGKIFLEKTDLPVSTGIQFYLNRSWAAVYSKSTKVTSACDTGMYNLCMCQWVYHISGWTFKQRKVHVKCLSWLVENLTKPWLNYRPSTRWSHRNIQERNGTKIPPGSYLRHKQICNKYSLDILSFSWMFWSSRRKTGKTTRHIIYTVWRSAISLT